MNKKTEFEKLQGYAENTNLLAKQHYNNGFFSKLLQLLFHGKTMSAEDSIYVFEGQIDFFSNQLALFNESFNTQYTFEDFNFSEKTKKLANQVLDQNYFMH